VSLLLLLDDLPPVQPPKRRRPPPIRPRRGTCTSPVPATSAPGGPLTRTALLQAISGTAGNFGTGNFTTGSFTPPSNSLLVVGVGFIENNGTTTDPASSITLSGGGLTWTAGPSISSSPTSFPTAAKIFTAPVSSGSSMTLTVGSGGRAAGMYAVSVVAYTGYDTATPTGATATGQQNGGFSGPPTPASITLSAGPASTSEVFAAVAMDKPVLGVTPGSTPTVWTEIHDGMENTDWGGLESEIRTGSTSTSVSWDDLRSGGGALFNFAAVAIEIRAGIAATAVFVPCSPIRRRPFVPPRRPRAATVVPLQVAPAAPAYPPVGIREKIRGFRPFRGHATSPNLDQILPPAAPATRRPKALRPVRGRNVLPTPQQVAPAAPAYPPVGVRTRIRGLRVFRGRAASPGFDQTAPPAGFRARWKALRPARPRVAGPAPAQVVIVPPAYPPQPSRPRLKGLRLGRGRAAAPVPDQVVLVPPAYPPQNVRTRLRGLRLFRGHSATPVPAQQTVVATPPVPQSVRARIKGLRWFRGRTAAPSPVAVTPLPQQQRQRPHGPGPRRGRIAAPVPPQVTVAPPAYPPQGVHPRLKGLRASRPRRAAPIPPQIVIPPPPYPPFFARLKQHAARIFRGKSQTPLPAVCDCQTHRPNLGVTARPSTGTTSRPASGTTARPDAGMTFRPDSGTTGRPCTCQQ
jgi:hypothetical protein